jgi:translation initiation factor 3 subunit E
VDFVECLLVRFDFDGAQAKLAECESVIVTDFFLSYLTSPAEFMEAARLFIFETYCRIHQKIDLPVLAAKLHMDEDAAERWVVDLIRSASLDAKIDSVGRQVIMTVPAPSVYQAVMDKTRELAMRTRVLADNIDSYASGEGGRGRGERERA